MLLKAQLDAAALYSNALDNPAQGCSTEKCSSAEEDVAIPLPQRFGLLIRDGVLGVEQAATGELLADATDFASA